AAGEAHSRYEDPRLAGAATLGRIAATSPARAAVSDSPFPVRVSANGRHLVDARGQPFLLHGDTAWSLLVQLTKDETEEYLENRRQKGFTAILVQLISKFATNPPKNKYGNAPFTTSGDFSTPNEAYYAHADWVVQKAGEKGILLVLNPCFTGWSSNGTSSKDGFLNEIIANGPTKCRDYGRYVGNRYKNFANIIWQAVGDMMVPRGGPAERNWLEILQGIKEFAPSHHWTAHYDRFTTALDQPAFAPHMTLDNAYTGNRTYARTLIAYNRTNPKPTFVNEAYYEDTGLPTDNGTPALTRAQAYWALLGGATGQTFGSQYVWSFGAPPHETKDWRTGMDRQPSRAMVHVKALFEGRAWHNLVPDQNHTVVTSGYGTFGVDDLTIGGDYVTAARTGDGTLVMAYVPSTETDTRSITVNMARLSGKATARWFNPTTGTYTAINGAPLANSGSREFTTPGDNGTGTNDWVLVLETMRAGDSSSEVSSKRRVIVMTDIGPEGPADEDDVQSLIRFMLYTNEVDVEALIATRIGDATVRKDYLQKVVNAYGQVHSNLLLHKTGYPTPRYLLRVIKGGHPIARVEDLGPTGDSEGSNAIIAAVDQADARPVYVFIWGGSYDLAQALWRVRNDRGTSAAEQFAAKIRVYCDGDQYSPTGPWIRRNFPNLFWVHDGATAGDKWTIQERNLKQPLRGFYLGGDRSLVSVAWINANLRGRGPLGDMYPAYAGGVNGVKDAHPYLVVIPSGLHDPDQPTWGGWGGRFGGAGPQYFSTVADTVGSETSGR
ncbi:MAG: DUF4038 domain-containing protein, partial [Planctomycetes bacterium]|nr:DUF4038 domain-containing protein [Planctomycetota bacterium]